MQHGRKAQCRRVGKMLSVPAQLNGLNVLISHLIRN
jgi:hypothetical protein